MVVLQNALLKIIPLLHFSCPMVTAQPPSEFWIKAEKTLLLSDLRTQSQWLKPTVNDSVIASPRFLPLCGNGRIDTKDDYAAYYQDTKNLPLRLTRQQILFNNYGVTDPDIFHDVTVFEDEQCDDGNRVDFDGCSADCMYLDVWTSACELAVDNTLLAYEDIVYDTERKSMVVSATTGIYALEQGDTSLKAQLLAPKSFPVANMFRHGGSLILYSSKEQALWQLVDGQSEITLIRNIPQLAKWDPTYFAWNCKPTPAGSIIVRDNSNLLYLKTPAAEPFVCPIGRMIDVCIFVTYNANTDVSRVKCESATVNLRVGVWVNIGAGVCEVDVNSNVYSVSFWDDIFNLISLTLIMQIKTNQFIKVSPDIPGVFFMSKPLSYNYYLPLGGFIQGTGSSARKLGSPKLSRDIFYFSGDPSLINFILGDSRACGQERCVFDGLYGYDALNMHTVDFEEKRSLNDILQQCILEEAAISPQLSDLNAIKTNSLRYSRLLTSFAAIYWNKARSLEALGMQEHPITHNIWAVRKDRLIEVSKSGVILQRADGKCIPSGVALCPPCQWASNGQKCRPCSEVDRESLAWNKKCKDSCSSSSRRLLLTAENVIRFVLSGNFATVSRVWQGAVKGLNGDITVEISTPDAVAEMQRVQVSLLAMTDVQVLTRPYVVIPVVTSSSSEENTGVIVGAVLGACGGVVLVALLVYKCLYVSRTGADAHPLTVTGYDKMNEVIRPGDLPTKLP